jgi:hypothetical protein
MNSGLRRGSRAVAIFALTTFANGVSASPRADDSPVAGLALKADADPTADPQAKPPREDAAPKKKDKDAPLPPGWHRDGFEVSNGDFKFALNGYLQENLRSYNWDVAGGDETKRSPTDELGRLRMGFETSYRGWSLQFVVDPRNSETYKLKDFHLTYEFSKKISIAALTDLAAAIPGSNFRTDSFASAGVNQMNGAVYVSSSPRAPTGARRGPH